MAVVTLNEAAKRNPSALMRGLMLGIVTTDQLAAAIPFRTFQGMAATYRREFSLPAANFVPDAGTLATPTVGKESLVTVPVRRVEGDMDVDSLADDLSGGAEMGGAVLSKVKSTWRKVTEKVVTGGNVTSHAIVGSTPFGGAIDAIAYGPWLDSVRMGPGEIKYVHTGTFWSFRAPGDVEFGDPVAAAADGTFTLRSSNPSKYIKVTLDVSDATANDQRTITFASNTDEFDGLNRIISPSMIVPSGDANGDLFGFAAFDKLLSMVKVRENLAFIINSLLELKFLSIHRALGGTNPEHMALPGFSGRVLSYRGVPVLINDNIPSNEAKGSATTLTSAYLASLSAPEGLYLGVPGTGHDSVDVEGDPRRSNALGWRIERLGSLEGVSHRRTRIRWSGCLCLGSDLALARASELITE